MITDIKESRLNIAKELGANSVYTITMNTTELEKCNAICKLFDGQPNVTIDATGVESSIRLALLVSH